LTHITLVYFHVTLKEKLICLETEYRSMFKNVNVRRISGSGIQ